MSPDEPELYILWRDVRREWRGGTPSKYPGRWPASLCLFVPDVLGRLYDLGCWRMQLARFRAETAALAQGRCA